MMKEIVDQAALVLERSGWTIKRSQGEVTARIAENSEQGQIIVQARAVRGEVKITFICSVSRIAFNSATQIIRDGREAEQEPIEQCRILRSRAEYIDEDFAGMEAEFREWWGQVDLDQTIAGLTETYSQFGSGPLHHLAALAVSGREQTLADIRTRFENGDTTGFLPYITTDFVDRALKIAQQSESTS